MGRAPRASGRGAALPGAKLGGGAASFDCGRRRRRSSWLISLPWPCPRCRSMYCAAARRRGRRSGADRGRGRIRGCRVLGRIGAQVLVLGGAGESAGGILTPGGIVGGTVRRGVAGPVGRFRTPVARRVV